MVPCADAQYWGCYFLFSYLILFTICRNCLDDVDSLYTGKIIQSRPVKADHVPRSLITSAELPFQVMNMDCLGPLDPPSAQGHIYCLCIVDSCTRWPTVYALKILCRLRLCVTRYLTCSLMLASHRY